MSEMLTKTFWQCWGPHLKFAQTLNDEPSERLWAFSYSVQWLGGRHLIELGSCWECSRHMQGKHYNNGLWNLTRLKRQIRMYNRQWNVVRGVSGSPKVVEELVDQNCWREGCKKNRWWWPKWKIWRQVYLLVMTRSRTLIWEPVEGRLLQEGQVAQW